MDFFDSKFTGYSRKFLTSQDEIYVNKYWLDANILSSTWKDVLDSVFVIDGSDVKIINDIKSENQLGGILFVEDEFEIFKISLRNANAKKFIVVEDIGQEGWNNFSGLEFFRFCFPNDIEWNEMTSSCQLANDVFSRPIRAFFVVSDNGLVGKYTNNDACPPYELVFPVNK